MKEASFFSDRVYPVLFMIIITALCIFMVSGIYITTEDLVRINETLFLKRAVLFAAGKDVPEDPLEVDEIYNELVTEREGRRVLYRSR